MTKAFSNYMSAYLAIGDATSLDERVALNIKAITYLHIEMFSYSTALQTQFEPWFTQMLKWHGRELTHCYGELWMGNELEWKGVGEGLVRKRRPGLAAERDDEGPTRA